MELFKEKKKSRRKKKQEKSLQKKSSTMSDASVENTDQKHTKSSNGTPQKDNSKVNQIKSYDSNQPVSGTEGVKEKNKASKKGKANNDTNEKEKRDPFIKDDSFKESIPHIDKAQNQHIQGRKDVSTQESSSSNDSESASPPGFLAQSTQSNKPSRCSIHVPHTSDPLVKPTATAAKIFISLYYPSITHGLTSDLCCYFCENSQKSISVGGAHSVVTGLDGITMQITSLSGCQFNVRGVVAQDTADGGAHLLITGICTPKGGLVTAFAHSIGLERVKEKDDEIGPNGNSSSGGHRFMIHNDALSLLNGEMAMATEQQQQLEAQRKQHFHHHEVMMEEKSNNHLYARSEQGPSLLKPPGLFE